MFGRLTTLDFDYATWQLLGELGYNLNPWSELALGLQGLTGDIEARNFNDSLDVGSVGPYLRFTHDTLDNVFFPTHGEAAELTLGYYRNRLEGQEDDER
ncbi:hypothetical protein MBH78_01985 [Oceanimonas sp. NS1]|nr:hypothetical protein [Oceanimonas sp. NS1]